MKSNNTNAGATNASSASGEGGQNPVVTPTKPPSREHVLSRDCWCQPTLDGEAPDEVSLSEQIEHQRSIYDGDTETFGTESEWTIKSGSILASLLELQLRRDSAPIVSGVAMDSLKDAERKIMNSPKIAADTVVEPVEPTE